MLGVASQVDVEMAKIGKLVEDVRLGNIQNRKLLEDIRLEIDTT